jgi:hypothetical protein
MFSATNFEEASYNLLVGAAHLLAVAHAVLAAKLLLNSVETY